MNETENKKPQTQPTNNRSKKVLEKPIILTQVINGLIDQQKEYRQRGQYFQADQTQERIKELIAVRKVEAKKRKLIN